MNEETKTTQEETVTLTKTQVNNVVQYLKEVGIEVEDVTTLGNLDPESFRQRANATTKSRLLNSADGFYNDLREDFKNKKESEVSQKVIQEVAAAFLLAENDVAGKTVNQVIEIAKERVNLNKSESEKQLQNQLIERNNEIEKLKNEIIPSIKSEVEVEKDDFYKSRLLLDSLNNLDTGNVKSTTALRAIENNLNKKYQIQYDREGNSLRWIDKNTGLEVLNAAENAMKSTTDILADELRAENLLNLNTTKTQETASDNTERETESNKTTYTKTNTTKVHPKAQARLDELKRKAEMLNKK